MSDEGSEIAAAEDAPGAAPPATPSLSPLVKRALARELARRRQLGAHAQLGIAIDAAPEEIEAAFRRLERQYDPQAYAAYGDEAVEAAAGIEAVLHEAYERMRAPAAATAKAEAPIGRWRRLLGRLVGRAPRRRRQRGSD